MRNRIKYLLALWAALLLIPFTGYSQYFIYSGEQPIDLDVKFVKHSLESAAKKTFFNVLKVYNKANRSETFTLTFTVPDGWSFVGNSKQEITINPYDSIYVPVMVSIGSQVRGDIGYSVIASLTDSRGNTVKNEYCFIKIPRETDLMVKIIDRSAFLDQRTGMASIGIKIDNKGNRDELVNFIFESDPELGVGPSKQKQYAYEVVMPPYTDSVFYVDVTLLDIENVSKNTYRLNMQSSTIDSTFQASIWFRKLDANYYNYISETRKPLVVELNLQGLLQSEKIPSLSSRAEGILLLPKNKDIYYYYRNFNTRSPEALYLYNRMYAGTHLNNWQFEIGDGYRSIESNLSGRGGYVAFNNKKIIVDLIGTNNLRTKNLNFGSTQYFKVSNYLNFNSGIAYNQNSTRGIHSKLGILGSTFTLAEVHRFYLMGALNILNQNIDGKSKHNEFGGELKYNSKIKNLNTTVRAKYGSNLYYGNYRGRLNVKYQSIYQISPNQRVQLFGYENWNEVPQIVNEVTIDARSSKNRDINTDYLHQLGQRIMLNGGVGYEEFNWRGISEIEDRTFIHTQGYKVNVGARFKLDEKQTYLTPQVTYSRVHVKDYPQLVLTTTPDVLDRQNFSYQYFSLNLRSKFWGVLASYTSGPKSIFEQYSYFYNARANRRLRAMPYIDAFIYKNQLQLLTNVSYSNDLIGRSTYTNITSQLYWYLPKDWRINLLFAYSLQNRVDAQEVSQTYQTFYMEAGVKKEFNWSHPRIGFHNVSLIFFKDFDGNGTQGANEPGIKNVLVSLQRQLTPEIGFIPGDISTVELLSDNFGKVYLENIPTGLYTIQYNPVGRDAGTFSKALGDVELNITENSTHYIPFVEKNKVYGKIILNRSRLSGLGRIDVSNVRITATDSQGRSYTSLTDKNGSFILFAPITDEYILNINNIFYENFDLRQNNFIVKFNGYKQFEVNYVFDEKVRRINFATTPEGEGVTGVQQVRRTNISGTVKDANSQSPVRARVNLVNTRTNAIVNSTYSSAVSGEYTMSFMAADNYLLEVLADDYWYLSENLVLNQVTTFMNINRNVLLRPISVGSKVELNIRFDVNSSFLAPESVAELNRLLRIVKQNPTVKLEVQGHCDDLEALQRPEIALDRAKAVAKYLVENGFSNVEVKSLGNTIPIAANDTEESRTRNRRVEVEVLSK